MGLFERAEREVLSLGGSSGAGEAEALKRGLGLWVEGQTELGFADIMAGPCEHSRLNVVCGSPAAYHRLCRVVSCYSSSDTLPRVPIGGWDEVQRLPEASV